MAITQTPPKAPSEPEKQIKRLSRRNFFKYSLASGVGVGAAVMGADKLIPAVGTSAEAAPKMGKEHDSIPVEIAKDYKRMNQKNTVFCRFGWDPKIIPLGKEFGGKFHGMIPPAGEPGWTEVESALSLAAWSVDHDAATNSEFGIPNQGLYRSIQAQDNRIRDPGLPASAMLSIPKDGPNLPLSRVRSNQSR